jgi:DNA-binding PadR family transcriptional regulator
MRGMLSFMILWLLSRRPMYGQELAAEIGKRRGDIPNPGTIYPALKDLASRGMIVSHLEGRNNVYELTERGRAGLANALKYFRRAFGEIFDSTLAPPEERVAPRPQSPVRYAKQAKA